MPLHVARHSSVHGLLREMRTGVGLIVFGALVGVSGFVVVDSLREPEHQTRDGMFAFRGPYYASCREAFMEGRANIRQGEPGYRSELDADGDGLACEPYTPRR